MNEIKKIRAFAFDLDGTIVDSKLDFDKMREDLGFPIGVPILEHLETIDCADTIAKSHEIINRHEEIGAKQAELIAGVEQLLSILEKENIPVGILTRNSAHVAKISLDKFNLKFDVVLSRDDCKAKPDPEGLEIMANKWNVDLQDMAFIGDHHFDIDTANNASAIGILYDPTEEIEEHEADYVISHYDQLIEALL